MKKIIKSIIIFLLIMMIMINNVYATNLTTSEMYNDFESEVQTINLSTIISNAIRWISKISLFCSIIVIIVGIVNYLKKNNKNEEEIQKAKHTLLICIVVGIILFTIYAIFDQIVSIPIPFKG